MLLCRTLPQKEIQIIRFLVTLERLHREPRHEVPSTVLLPYNIDDDPGKVREIGEALILEVILSEHTVEKLKHDYMESDGCLAIKNYIEHQLGYGNSVENWISMYGRFRFMTAKVVQRPM